MSIRAQLIGGLVAGALAFGAGWLANGWRMDAKLARQDAAHATVLEQMTQATVASVEAARTEEARRTAAVEKQRDLAQKVAAAARADADTRAASERWLRQRIDTLLAGAVGSNPSLADGGPAAGAPIDMLAHVLGRALEAAGQLAEYADQARGAGLTCERSYDAVRRRAKDIGG